MTQAGNLIVFEGPDGVGKSCVSRTFAEILHERHQDVEIQAFPGNTPGTLGELVYRLHHDPVAGNVHSITAASLQTLHIAAHLDTIESKIRPMLEEGRTVILDRFWWSTWVYGLADGVDRGMLTKLTQIEKIAWGRWQPTALFCLSRDCPLSSGLEPRWNQWSSAYQELVVTEAGNYPIHPLENKGSVAAAALQALACLKPL